MPDDFNHQEKSAGVQWLKVLFIFSGSYILTFTAVCYLYLDWHRSSKILSQICSVIRACLYGSRAGPLSETAR